MAGKLRDILKGALTKKEAELVPSSFDIVGDILIFPDFPEGLRKKEKLLGRKILENYKQVKAVFKKSRKYSGRYRTPKLKHIAGEKRKETIYKENNSMIKLDVEKVYFSPRLSTERKRIFLQTKRDESVLVMFSGCGVYPITIARNSNAGEVFGIEINPRAHGYALENAKLNKVNDKVRLYHGDAKKIAPQIKKKFDRVVMPLPKGAGNYLETALPRVKKGGVVHFYSFAEEDKYEVVKDLIKEKCRKKNFGCRILRVVKCGQFSPGTYRICVDFRVA